MIIYHVKNAKHNLLTNITYSYSYILFVSKLVFTYFTYFINLNKHLFFYIHIHQR